MSKVLGHAGCVSSLSMFTTAVAFAASIGSPISIIRAFAAFQTILVITDYVLLLALLVPLMVCWRSRIVNRNRAAHLTGRLLPSTVCRLFRAALLPLRVLSMPASPTFWRRYIAPKMYHARHGLLWLWILLFVVQAGSCAFLKSSTGAPSLFGFDHPLERRIHISFHD